MSEVLNAQSNDGSDLERITEITDQHRSKYCRLSALPPSPVVHSNSKAQNDLRYLGC
jgi:hypothetical protein